MLIDRVALLGRSFLQRCFEDLRQRGIHLLRTGGAGRSAGVALGVGSLEEPGGGSPMGAGGALHDLERIGLGALSQSQLVMEVFIAFGFALHGAERDADVFGGLFNAGAAGDEVADLGLFGLVEGAATAADVGGHGWAPISDLGFLIADLRNVYW